MSEAQGQVNKKEVELIYVYLVIAVLLFLAFSYLLQNHLLPEIIYYDNHHHERSLVGNVIFYTFLYKITYTFSLAYILWLIPSKKAHNKPESEKTKWLVYTLITLFLFLVPYINVKLFDLTYMPIMLVLHTIALITYSKFFKKGLKEDEGVFGISKKKEDELSIRLGCKDKDNGSDKQDYIVIHKSTQGVYINAGPGGGKTILLQHFIRQFGQKGFAGVMYDFEGDLREFSPNNSENPLVNSRTILTFIDEAFKNRNHEGLSTYYLFEKKGVLNYKDLDYQNIEKKYTEDLLNDFDNLPTNIQSIINRYYEIYQKKPKYASSFLNERLYEEDYTIDIKNDGSLINLVNVKNIKYTSISEEKISFIAHHLDIIGLDVLKKFLINWKLYKDEDNNVVIEKGQEDEDIELQTVERYILVQTKGKIKYYYQAIPVKYAHINFVSPEHSVRINPLNKLYHKDTSSLRNVIELFLKAIDPELVKKTDFWGKNGISYTQAIALRLYKDHPDKLTIPHIITFLLSNYKEVLDWLAEDPESRKQAATIMTSYDAEAEGQLAGSTASGQAPVQPLFIPSLFWILSPPKEEEFNLDITNPKDPYFLSIGNAPEMSMILSPIISTILNVCMINMNKLGKRKSVWFADEFPTITMNPDEMQKLPATGRKKKIVTIIATQTDKQIEDKYGKVKAKNIMDNLSTHFQGKTPSDETAESWAKKLGKVKKLNRTISNSHDGTQSDSESLQKDDVIQPRDVQGQSVGHFMGIIADGKPPHFSLQFDYFDQNQIIDKVPIMNRTIRDLELELSKEEKNQIWENMIEMNFKRINSEVEEILNANKSN